MRDFRRNAIALALSASMARMASGQACADPALDDTLRLTLNVLATPPVTGLVAVLDFHRLGKTDLLVQTEFGLAILVGDGQGGFRQVPITGIETTVPPSRWAWTDLDGDGSLDVVVCLTGNDIPSPSPPSLETFLGDGRGAFRHAVSVPLVGIPSNWIGTFVLGDIDGDGRLDVVSNGVDEGLAVQRLLAGRTFAPPVHLSSFQSSIQTADIDGDGRTDLVPTNLVRSPFPVFVNRCRPGFARSFTVPIVLESRGVGGTLFSSEIVLTNRGSTEVTVDLTYTAAFGDGSGSASLAIPIGRQRILTDVISDLRSLGVPIPDGDGRGRV